MTSLFEKPDVRQLLEQTDSPTVGDDLTEPNDVAAMTPLWTSDIDVQAMLPTTTPGSLRVRWQHRYGNWLAASDVIVVTGVVATAHILRFGNVTSGSLCGQGRPTKFSPSPSPR